MKLLLSLLALCAVVATEQVQAYPSTSNVSEWMNSSSGGNAGRLFYTSRTDTSIGCMPTSGTTCGTTNKVCYEIVHDGYKPSGNACCHWEYTCRAGDEGFSQAEFQLAQEEKEKTAELAKAFADSSQRVDYFWGYVNTTARSPNAGRAQSAPARLDACIGHAETDMLGTGSSGWASCYNKCDSSSNGHCTSSGINDASSVSAAVCKDRCDCTMGFGTCENL